MIIEISSKKKMALADIAALVAPTGLNLDLTYPPIPMGDPLTSYIVRGQGDAQVVANLRAKGFQVFSDPQIGVAK